MKIALSDEQKLLVGDCSKLSQRPSADSENRECIENGIFQPKRFWKEMVALGWNGVNIEAQYGGLGLGLKI